MLMRRQGGPAGASLPDTSGQRLAEEARAYAEARFGSDVYSEVKRRFVRGRLRVDCMVQAAFQRQRQEAERRASDTVRALQAQERAWKEYIQGIWVPPRAERRTGLVRGAWASAVRNSLSLWHQTSMKIYFSYLKHGPKALRISCRRARDKEVERTAELLMVKKFHDWEPRSRLDAEIDSFENALCMRFGGTTQAGKRGRMR